MKSDTQMDRLLLITKRVIYSTAQMKCAFFKHKILGVGLMFISLLVTTERHTSISFTMAQIAVSKKKQQVENAMAAAVLQYISKDFNKPKLYEVTITENIQPDIVGFILATKKRLFCMTLDELDSLFPEQSFLDVQLNNSIGPQSVHRASPFTPDDNLKTLVNKYLAKHEPAGTKKRGNEPDPSRVCEDEYEEYSYEDDESVIDDKDNFEGYNETVDEKSEDDYVGDEFMGDQLNQTKAVKHVTFEKPFITEPQKQHKNANSSASPQPLAKRAKVSTRRSRKTIAAGATVSAPGDGNQQNNINSCGVMQHYPVQTYNLSSEHHQRRHSTPDCETKDIIGRAATLSDIVNQHDDTY